MKIVAAVDGSDHSTRALDFAAGFAASVRAELLIVTVQQRLIDEETRRFGRIENATIGDILGSASLKLAALSPVPVVIVP